MRRRWVVLLSAVAVAVIASPLPASGVGPVIPASPRLAPGCVAAASPATAAQALLHPAAEVVRVERVDELTTALASVPVVVGGARHRLVQAPTGEWCDGLAGFNAVATGDDVAKASAFARVAAARYFDGVTVQSARRVAPGRVELQTHALTNGVVATWNVAVDRDGIRHASWKATSIAVKPFEAEIHGPTALPGATMEYVRDTAGPLVAVRDPFAEAASEDPSPIGASVVQMSDGFTVNVSRGHAPYVFPRARTGAWDVDVLGIAVESTRHNYEDFLSWGLSGTWTGPGHVFIDGGLAPYCGACVLPSAVFNVHMLSAFPTYAEALGYTYPDPALFFSTVMGHEIFHNFQSAHGSTYFPSAFVEGMARFQETLHDYSHVSHQPGSIVYGDGINGCNGYLEYIDYSLSDHIYDACYVWMSVYADHGIDVVKKLLETDGFSTSLEDAIEQATGVPLESTMSNFATRALTGSGLVWGPVTGSGPTLDWAEHLDRWSPGPLGQVDSPIGSAAVVGGRITASTAVSVSGPARFTVVRQGPGAASVADVVSGATVAGPEPGEAVWVVAATGRTYGPVTISTDGSGSGGDTAALTWDRFRTYQYSSALLPTQSAAAAAVGDVESKTFDLHAEAADRAASPYSASASADSGLMGSATLAEGDYAFIAEIEFDRFDLTEAGGLVGFRSASSRGSVDAWVWCEYSYCSAYDSYYVYSDYGDEPVKTVKLMTLLHVDRAQPVEVNVSTRAGASSSGGTSSSDLEGRVVGARFVRID